VTDKDSGLKVRPLNVNDLYAMAGMMAKTGSALRDSLGSLEAMDQKAVFFTVFEAFFIHAADDTKAWLHSLIVDEDMPREQRIEEFSKMPIDTPIDIIEQLSEKEDLKSFFSKVLALMQKVKPIGKKSRKQ
jgi:uncharacterized protein with von Willebrand factor type A (vWA) domain